MGKTYSNTEKLALSGWFYENNEREYHAHLKLQKFLFFYESFCYADDEKSDFGSLQGWKDGPVFGTVYRDYRYEQELFLKEAKKKLKENGSLINEDKAKMASFVVSIMNKQELSLFTHEFNIWKDKQSRIDSGEQKVSLNSSKFNSNDFEMLSELKNSYPLSMINASKTLAIGDKVFLMSIETKLKLSEKHKDVLEQLAVKDTLINPVYVDLNEDGVLVID